MDNSTRRQLLDRARASGFPGSILDVYSAYGQGRDLIQEFVQEQQAASFQPPMQVAQTPEEQEQGLRPAHEAGNVDKSMAFPNVQPGQSFNTVGMKVPINIDKVDNQGNLVESFKAVPPGIQNLPTGPYEGTVIESPARMQKGGVFSKYQKGGKKADTYVTDNSKPWWNPKNPSEWNPDPSWSDSTRRRLQADLPSGYALPTVEISAEKTPENRRKDEEAAALAALNATPPVPQDRVMFQRSQDRDANIKMYDDLLDRYPYYKKYDTLTNNDTLIDITNKKMGWFAFNEIPGQKYTDVLGNNYVERTADGEGYRSGSPEDYAKNWTTRMQDPNDTFRNKDYAEEDGSNYHTKNIPAFYGVEGGKFKVANNPSDFDPNTVIVPIRNEITPYEKVDWEFNARNLSNNLYTYNKDGKKVWNISRKDKFLVHSPNTNKSAFISIGPDGADKAKSLLEDFSKNNPGAYIISMDEGRFDKHLHSSEGLTDKDYELWNSKGGTILENYLEQDPTNPNVPISSPTGKGFGYNLGILKQKTGGSYQTNQEISMYEWRTGRPEESRKRYIVGGLKNRVLYNKAKYKR